MIKPADTPDLETLLRHATWVRLVARRLLGDYHAAEDVAQDTLLASLEHRPHPAPVVSSWLGAVARNLARMSLRQKKNREKRERATARPEALPSAAQVTEQIETQRAVASALLELDELYRHAILLRYYRELPVQEIARLQTSRPGPSRRVCAVGCNGCVNSSKNDTDRTA